MWTGAPLSCRSTGSSLQNMRHACVHRKLVQHRRKCTGNAYFQRSAMSIIDEYDALQSTDYESSSSIEEHEWTGDILHWQEARPSLQRVKAPAGAPPIVILPGFGNCAQDYEAPFGVRKASLMAALEARGFRAYVVPIERKSWFQVGKALFTFGFWKGALTTDPGYTWYLYQVHETVKLALQETGASKVDLVGHSAGGWLGRAYLADASYYPANTSITDQPSSQTKKREDPSFDGSVDLGQKRNVTSTPPVDSLSSVSQSTTWQTTSLPSLPSLTLQLPPFSNPPSMAPDSSNVLPRAPSQAVSNSIPNGKLPKGLAPNPWVRSLITLGTPQRPVPPDKGQDRTGGALSWVHATYPGAFFANQGVMYGSVGGRTVRGNRQPGDAGSKGPRTPPQYAYDSYEQVCGEGQGVEGDAVVPLSCAFLGGSRQVLLEGVWHSMSRIGTFEEPSGRVWYGSEEVLDSWLWLLTTE
ncbi:hypothetical protein CEUSTIGMA_g6951.t1 [Chlamydomonas eustigma]|uniref:Uncharacterized protein n=1 Tax=Chlamydomonas eustigma TaxID=1157962 RepID=A0A250X9S0_9CHLO|nr:hypothetical protein CEUSTIGMA_g6951.t1 [Chlamydomonas eustigma]|eukprot:GAX79510.1 hypothetical protein CEUSTIGMA_g6951.t1 [Chlamydomonas eustigma]